MSDCLRNSSSSFVDRSIYRRAVSGCCRYYTKKSNPAILYSDILSDISIDDDDDEDRIFCADATTGKRSSSIESLYAMLATVV